MIASIDTATDRERLVKIAAEYSKKGYEVVIEPQQQDLPDFLQSYQPAIIARQGKHNIVIEIASRHSPKFQHYLPTLIKEIEQQDGWQLDLVMTKSEKPSDSLSQAEPLSLTEVQSRLKIAKEMTTQPLESVIVYVWSLAEAALRLLSKQENLDLQGYSTNDLIKKLVVEGVISRAEYQCFIDSLTLRNHAIHSFQVNDLNWEMIDRLIATTEQILEYLSPQQSP
jgi:uncharacterized protein YutE (UPF0331/DUF86 family)